MIPIECPKCGRRGNVPPDRLNSRLHCKACNAVFHLDNSGHLVLGEPGQAGKKKERSRAQTASTGSGVDFDLKEMWSGVPAPVKLGLPAVAVALLAWQFLFSGSGGSASYLTRSEAIGHAVVAKDKGRVTSLATADTAEAAGKWFDLMAEQATKQGLGADAFVSPALLAGNAEADPSLVVLLSITGGIGGEQKMLSTTLHMKRTGGSWQFDGQQSLAEAEKAATPSAGAARR